MNAILQRLPFGLMAFLAIGVSFYAFAYLFVRMPFLEGKGALATDPVWQFFFHLHFLGGGVALLIGWLQFWRGFRNNNMALHRW